MNQILERTAVVLAAGGERVVPWEIGVLAGFADAGLDLRRAGLISGTSAGALVAARLALGIDQGDHADRIARNGAPDPPGDLVARAASVLPALLELDARTRSLDQRERLRRIGRFALDARTITEQEHVAAVTSRVPTGDWPAALRLRAIDARTGELIRLDAGSSIAVARGVAAARAVPGVLPAVRVGERRLVDAAAASGTNADTAIAEGIERALVITAAGRDAPAGTLDAALDAGVSAELDAVRERGVVVEVIRADAEARAAMGDELYRIVDARAAVDAGRRAGRASAAALAPLAA